MIVQSIKACCATGAVLVLLPVATVYAQSKGGSTGGIDGSIFLTWPVGLAALVAVGAAGAAWAHFRKK